MRESMWMMQSSRCENIDEVRLLSTLFTARQELQTIKDAGQVLVLALAAVAPMHPLSINCHLRATHCRTLAIHTSRHCQTQLSYTIKIMRFAFQERPDEESRCRNLKLAPQISPEALAESR